MAAYLYSGINYLTLSIDTPYDNISDASTLRDDLVGVKVWYSTIQGFNPINGQGTLAFNGLSLSITINNLNPNTRYYVRYALISAIDTTTYSLSDELTEITDIEPTAGRTVSLAPTYNAFVYTTAGTTPSPASSTITATTYNFASQTPYFEWYIDGTLVTGNNTNTLTYTPRASYSNMPDTISVKVRDGISTSPVVAEDSLVMFGVIPGSNAITVVNYNPAHSLFTTSAGAVTYTGSGTSIQVLEGSTYLTVDSSATPANGTFKVTATGENGYITPSTTITTVGGTTVQYGDHSNMTQNTARIIYTVTVKDSGGNTRTFVSYQNFTKSIQGAQGAKGDKGDSIQGDPGFNGIVQRIAYQKRSQTETSAPTYNGTTSGGTSLPSTVDSTWQNTVPAATVGEVVWYIYGRYNPNASAYQGIADDTTVWSAPIAASVFQDIKSDNWTGASPTASTPFPTGSAGYYLKKAGGTNNADAGLYAENAYIKGSLIAGSIIAGSVTLDSNTGTSLSTISTNASSALAGLANKLTASSSYTLTGVVDVENTGGIRAGTVSWNTTTGEVTSGSGVVLTEKGITGVQSGTVKFSIDNLGNATFGGQLSAATGTFAGALVTGTSSDRIVINENNNLEIQGYTTEGGSTPWFSLGVGDGPPTDALNKSVFKIYASSFPFNANVVDIQGGKSGYYAVSINNSALSPIAKGLEVKTFDAESVVIARNSTIIGGDAVTINNAKGTTLKLTANTLTINNVPVVYHALHITAGTFNYGGVTIAIPPNNTTQYLRADGTWQTVTSGTSYTLPTASATVLGGIKVGTRLSIDANGVLSADVQSTSYTLPLAASGTRGGVQVGYVTTGRNYAVQLSGEQMYVNVPWTDTDTDTVTRLRGTTSGSYTSGDLTLAAGSNVTISQVGSTITINSSYTDTNTITNLRAGTGDTYINGDITFVGSGATTVSRSGNTITISSTDNVGSGADGNTYVTSASFSGGSLTLTRNDNVTISVSLDGRYLTSVSWTDVTGKPGFATVATSGSYTDLLNKPTLFSGSYTDLTNKPTLFSGSYTDLTNKPTLFSGSYTDLTNKPTIPAAQVNSDWNATTGVAVILNKPTIPTNTNQLTNGAGYITSYTETDTLATVTSRGATTTAALSTGALTVSGAITATGEITAYSSDNRLKTNIESIANAVDKLKQLNGVTYNWNALANTYGFDTTVKQAGLLAQEVQAVLPEAVKPAPFDINEHGNSRSGENYITIQYEKLIPLLVEAIKEQQTQIDQLKKLLEAR
jgi:hypothetical protein